MHLIITAFNNNSHDNLLEASPNELRRSLIMLNHNCFCASYDDLWFHQIKEKLLINLNAKMCWTRFHVTFALNSARRSKCRAKSVAKTASMTRNRNLLNCASFRLASQACRGLLSRSLQPAEAWWFSRTERLLYNTALHHIINTISDQVDHQWRLSNYH